MNDLRLHARRRAAADPEGAHRHPRRRDGHDDPALQAERGRLPRRALQGPPEEPEGQQRPAAAHAARRHRARSTRQYLRAGADIVETNTFGATSVAQADYGLGALRARDERRRRAAGARGAATSSRSADKPRFVAGALGPTPKTASISPDVNDPAARNVTFAELRDAYREQAEGLLEGGCDLFLVETIFDTLNAKAAIFALDELMEDERRAPAGDRLGHRHRRLGPHPLRPDGRRVLAQRAPRAAARDRPQLRARRGADAAVRRGAGAHRRRHLRELLSERRPAQSDERDRLRRDARDHRRPARGVRAGRASSTSPAAAAARRPSTSR